MSLATGLLNYYRFEEQSGTTCTDSCGVANGTTTNALVNQTGRIGKSYYFDGNGDYVTLASPYVATTGSFSIFAWVKPDFNTLVGSGGVYGPILEKGSSPYNAFRIVYGGDGLPCQIGCLFSSWTNGSGGITWDFDKDYNGQWIHVGVVWDFEAQKSRVFLNGKMVRENSDSTASAARTWSYIGTYNISTTNYMKGNIDELAVWNRALNDVEVFRAFSKGSNFLKGDLDYSIFNYAVGYWDLNKNALDVVGSNNGTVTGAVLSTNRLGQSNSTYYLDGVGDDVSLGTGMTSNPYSFCFWVNLATTQSSANTSFIIARSGATTTTYSYTIIYNMTSDYIRFEMYNTGGTVYYCDATSLTPETWYFVSCTFDGTYLKIYSNGVLINTSSAFTGSMYVGSQTTYIGRDSRSEDTYRFKGYVSEVSYFSKALSADEVKSLYDLSKNKVVYPLVKGWRD